MSGERRTWRLRGVEQRRSWPSVSGEGVTGPRFALMGSGEFLPWTEAVDRWLLRRTTRDGSMLIMPTASAPEGDEVFARWARMGLNHYDDLGIPADVVPLKTRRDAERPELIRMLATASVAFFSGGNPAYLAEVLRGSAFWEAMRSEMDRGLAYAGCSAGVASLGRLAIDSTVRDFASNELWKPGLGLFPEVVFAPHWDALDRFMPGFQEVFVSAVPTGASLVAIDEMTAMVGDGGEWSVMGAGGATLIRNGSRDAFDAGTSFKAPILATDTVEAFPADVVEPDPRPVGTVSASAHQPPEVER
jgi:cyanophycinase